MTTEKFYYPYVENFLLNSLGCFAAGQRMGPQHVGYADVLGARDLGGRESPDFEIIAVEVKLRAANFAKLLGQAHGYSLFAHKTYLAVPMKRGASFTAVQRELATRLGVGLIEIRGWRARQCREVLTPKDGSPMDSLAMRAMDALGYQRCTVCRNVVSDDYGFSKKVGVAREHGKILYWAGNLMDGRHLRRLMFVRGGPGSHYRFTYVCPACLAHLPGIKAG